MDNKAPEQLAEKQSEKISKHGGKRANSGGRRSGPKRFKELHRRGVPKFLAAVAAGSALAARRKPQQAYRRCEGGNHGGL
jgi:hypothetical protein